MNSIETKLSELTALYSPFDFDYNQSMSGPYVDYRDKTDDGETVAGLKDGRISGAWRPMVCAGTNKWQKSEIKRLWDISHDIYYLDFLIDGQLSEVSRFLLMKGYRARPVYTQVVDLTKTQEELHADLRKSYKSLVNKNDGMKLIYMQEYKILHECVKGRKRNEDTWNIQAQMLPMMIRRNDCAVMFYQNQYGMDYYASAVGKDVHALIWQAIWLLQHSISMTGIKSKQLDLGEQVFHPGQIMQDGKPATEKHCNISLFKKGFGGRTVTKLILEK